MGGNRSSKTTSCVVEAARAFVGKDPFEKYPKRAGVYFVFGIDAKHIGSVIYKKLFRAGAFKMIRDPKSMLWRSFNPLVDGALVKEAKPAPPLIPPRYIDWVVWDQKRAGIPACVVLKNGTEIHFFSINAEMPRGQDIDGAWIDEEAVKSGIIAEILARLVDRGGRLIWSATPQSGGDQLFDLMEQAGSVDVDLFHAHILDNPHIAEEEKDIFYRNLSEDERRVRWHGEPMLSGFTVYPEFSRVVHSFPEGRGWQPPDDWARYISVDPGRQVCYVSFLAVPPPWVGNFVVVHDELHLEKCDAEMFGKELGKKSAHGVTYEAALIDGNQCRVSDMGSGKSIEDQYREAMFKYGVRVRTGGFTWGADDLAPGIEAVHTWLRISGNGFPYARVLVENCPWLCREMLKYRYTKDQHGMPSNKVVKKNDHSCFIAGTMIATPTGDVPIETLRVGDEIMTHLGVGIVQGNAITDWDADLVNVLSDDGRIVTCTADHPFAEVNGDWVDASESEGKIVWRQRTLGSTERCTTDARRPATTWPADPTTHATRTVANCIKRFGSFITGQLNRVCTFITSMKTRPTTTLATSNCSRPKNTQLSILEILIWQEKLRKAGIEAMRAASGTVNICELSKRISSQSPTHASDAASLLNPASGAVRITAPTIANATLEKSLASMMRSDAASIAEHHSESTAISRRRLAPRDVSPCSILYVSNDDFRQPVYGLATSDGTYFANGFLVSNCDTFRYLAMANPKWVRPLARVKKDKFSSYENFLARKKAKAGRQGGGGNIIRFGTGTQ